MKEGPEKRVPLKRRQNESLKGAFLAVSPI